MTNERVSAEKMKWTPRPVADIHIGRQIRPICYQKKVQDKSFTKQLGGMKCETFLLIKVSVQLMVESNTFQ